MKKMFLLIPFVFCFLVIAGCQESVKNAKPVNVIVDGNGIFPKELAGLWMGDVQGWQIVFAEDGGISSAVIPLGRVNIHPGETKIVTTKSGGRGIYKAGKWRVEYSYISQELAVEIVIDYFKTQIGEGTIEGSVSEYLVGKVELGGWAANWLTSPHYIVNTSKYKNYQLPVDANEEMKVIFTKIP